MYFYILRIKQFKTTIMKKITLAVLLLFFTIFTIAQTIVGTTQENRNAILEEYTGIHCGYCPQGHAIANSIQASNPNDFYIINVHVGGYAVPGAGEPDFRTPFGSALDTQAGVSGYPMGSVNRHVFSGSNTAMSRGDWASSASQIMGQSSFVNVGVEAEIDISSRELTVHVEAYYTGNSPVNSNYLSVALLQNHTAGPQSGGNAGNNYDHNHRLIDMLTGQWGEEITTTSMGTFVDRTYTVTLPVSYNGIGADMSNLEVVAFMTQSQQEIISGKGAAVTTTGTLLTNDASLFNIESPKGNCALTVEPKLELYNAGQNVLTSAVIEYSVNGGATQSYTWNGNISSLNAEMITLPVTNIALSSSNTIEATIINTDNNTSNNTFTKTFAKGDYLPETFEDIHVFIATDAWGYELIWTIKNSNNVTVANGGGNGNNGSAGSYGDNITVTETYHLPMDCYKLTVTDSYGDGGNAVVIRTTDDLTNVAYVAGGYGAGDDVSFRTSPTAAVKETVFSQVSIYPNPSNGLVTFSEAKDLQISIFNILGKEVFNSTILTNNERLNLSSLSSGIYLVNLTSGDKKDTRKLIIK